MPDPHESFSALLSGGTSRRALLRGAGLAAVAVGVGAGIAGCAPGSTEGGASPSAGASSPPGSPSGGSNSSGAPAGIVVPVSEVPEGGGVVIQEKYVVTQPSAGQYKAFSAICTHQGCPVQKVENAQIVCPCHGSHFAIDSGDPVSGPAQSPLPPVEFTKSGGNLVLPN